MSQPQIEAWGRTSRFHCVGLVLDLEHASTTKVLHELRSEDARAGVRLARSLRHRFVVLAGQLLRKKAGAFTASIGDAAALPMAALAAAERLGEIGETFSMWFVFVDEPERGAVMAALARYAATEGSA